MGVPPHTAECIRRHASNMSRDKDPRLYRAFDNLMQHDEETMRRNNANRQAITAHRPDFSIAGIDLLVVVDRLDQLHRAVACETGGVGICVPLPPTRVAGVLGHAGLRLLSQMGAERLKLRVVASRSS